MTEYYPQTKESWSESSFGRVSWADLGELRRETGGRGPVCWRSNQAVVPGKGRYTGTRNTARTGRGELAQPSPGGPLSQPHVYSSLPT